MKNIEKNENKMSDKLDIKKEICWDKIDGYVSSDVMEAIQKSKNIEDLLSQFEECFVVVTLMDYLHYLLDKYNLKRADVIKASMLDPTFTYQLFSGIKGRPSRDKVLSLAIAMQIDISECQKLLRSAVVKELYAKDRRDAVIVFGLSKKLTVVEVNEILYNIGEYTL